MTAAQRQPAPEPEPERYTHREPATEHAGNGGDEPPREPPGDQQGATAGVAPWLAWELSRAAREARAGRNRVLLGLTLLIVAAVTVLVAGLLVDEDVFWAAAAPVFAAAATALIAYGADRLGVFAQTAELLGRRSEGVGTAIGANAATGDLTEGGKEVLRTGEVAYEVGVELATGESPSREKLLAAREVFAQASHNLHAEGARRCALLTLALDDKTEEARDGPYYFLLQGTRHGSTVAAYNLGAYHAQHPERQLNRDLLLAYADRGVGTAAFLVGLLDASPEAVQANELPPQEEETFLWP